VKYRLSLAVSFSSAVGYLVCTGTIKADFILLLAGIFLLTCGSAALNQYSEREQDSRMGRTKQRPVAAKRISERKALVLSVLLLIPGSGLLLLNGFMPFALGCLGITLYNLIYTGLKKITVFAIIPGAMVGSVPPLIGYASAGCGSLNDKIIFLSAFMFLWQIPHFWLLLIMYGKEYQAAGFRTIYDFFNERQIRLLISGWIILSVCVLSFFPVLKELQGNILSAIEILTFLFAVSFAVFLYKRENVTSLKYAFTMLNIYSFGVMAALIADSFI
jgi:protoheme IX farnesyltransferase